MFIMGDIFPFWLKYYFSNKRKTGTYFKHLVLKPIIDVIKKEVVQDLLFINRNLLKNVLCYKSKENFKMHVLHFITLNHGFLLRISLSA